MTFHAGDASTLAASTIVASQKTDNQTSFTVNIPPGISGTFTVVVAGFAGTGISGLGSASEPVSFTIGTGATCSGPPATPTNVNATRNGPVRLTWTSSPGADNYRVLALVPPTNATLFDGLVGNVAEVASDAVSPATPLILSVSAVNACGQSPLSIPVSLPAVGGPPICIPDAQTMCLFDGRFIVSLTSQAAGGPPGAGVVTRRFNDGGGFSFVNGSNVEDLFMRIENRCSTSGTFVVTFSNRSGFPSSTGFELLVADTVGSILRRFLHPAGAPFTSFTDSQSFNRCP